MKAIGPVLLVEDDPTDIFLMERSFAKAGITHELCVARNGAEAIQFLTQADTFDLAGDKSLPCLVVLDLKLPLKTGLEVLHWMTQQAVIKRIPVIVFTSSLDRGDIKGAYDSGANGYFLKTGSLSKMGELVALWRDYWLIHNEPPILIKSENDPASSN
jgi:CheY-like chemotaxis protein